MKEKKISGWGDRIAEERLRLGKTQDQIADLCGVTRRTIGNIERENNDPGGKLLVSLAKIGFDSQYLLMGVRSINLDRVAEEAGTYKIEKAAGARTDKEILLDKYERLSPGDRTRIQAIVDALASAITKGKKAKG
jgi:transcriptional regulator with XRE-family HTH domain